MQAAGAYICEDDANIANKVVQQHIPLLLLGPLCIQPDAALHQGVLSHEHHTVLAQTLQPQCSCRLSGTQATARQPEEAKIIADFFYLTLRMSWNCLDPTLSAATINARSYLSKNEHNLLSYCKSTETMTARTSSQLRLAVQHWFSYVLLLRHFVRHLGRSSGPSRLIDRKAILT